MRLSQRAMCVRSLDPAHHLRLLDRISLCFNVHHREQTWRKWACRPLREPRSRMAAAERVMHQAEWGALPEKGRSDEAVCTGHARLPQGLWLIKASFSKH